MPDSFLPYSRPKISEADIQGVVDALKNPMISQGDILIALESELCKMAEAKYASGYSSGTAAVHGMYHAAGIGGFDFCMHRQCCTLLGCKARFCRYRSSHSLSFTAIRRESHNKEDEGRSYGRLRWPSFKLSIFESYMRQAWTTVSLRCCTFARWQIRRRCVCWIL